MGGCAQRLLGSRSSSGAPTNLREYSPFVGTDTCLLTAGRFDCYARYMSLSDQELLNHLGRMPFVDTVELAMILGDDHATVAERGGIGPQGNPFVNLWV